MAAGGQLSVAINVMVMVSNESLGVFHLTTEEMRRSSSSEWAMPASKAAARPGIRGIRLSICNLNLLTLSCGESGNGSNQAAEMPKVACNISGSMRKCSTLRGDWRAQ